jgi:tetratricopeptide (TPR) repeat protein
MQSTAKKRLFLIFSLCSAAILCPAIVYSVAKAQEQSGCYMVEPSGQVRDLSGVCSPQNQEQNSANMATAEELFRRGREFDKQGQSEEAIAEYTRAIVLDPNYAEAYFFRGNVLALEGQPQKGIEDVQLAAAIYSARGQSERVSAMLKMVETIQRGIREGEF